LHKYIKANLTLANKDQYKSDESLTILLAITLIPGMGCRKTNQLLKIVENAGLPLCKLIEGNPKTVYRKIPELEMLCKGVIEILNHGTLHEAEMHLKRAEKSGLQIINILDNSYPASLKMFLDMGAPILLFLSGNEEILHTRGGAVVGTRTPTEQGIAVARQASKTLVGNDMTLISGGAVGVDWVAHDTAIQAGGMTVAFLPQGIGTYSLPAKWRDAMEEGRLLLASEYLPDAPWRTYAAVSRNALIAAQSQLVCVVEPRKQGGSIITARHAVQQGKPVLVEGPSKFTGTLSYYVTPLKQLQEVVSAVKKGGIENGSRPSRQSTLF
jgi:DNA processing protein